MNNEENIDQILKTNKKLSLLCECIEEAGCNALPKLIHDDAIRMMRTYSLSYGEAVHIVSNNLLKSFQERFGYQDDV